MNFFLVMVGWVITIALSNGVFGVSCEYVKEEVRRESEWKGYNIDKHITQERIQECTGEKK